MPDQQSKQPEWWLLPENKERLQQELKRLREKAFRERPIQAGPPSLVCLLPEAPKSVKNRSMPKPDGPIVVGENAMPSSTHQEQVEKLHGYLRGTLNEYFLLRLLALAKSLDEGRQNKKEGLTQSNAPKSCGNAGAYIPIPNPGWREARDLAEWPEWVEECPWRLMGSRDEDQRASGRMAQLDAEGRLANPLRFPLPFGDFECYAPIENPGPYESSALKNHPDWAQKFPWRIIWRRMADQGLPRERPLP